MNADDSNARAPAHEAPQPKRTLLRFKPATTTTTTNTATVDAASAPALAPAPVVQDAVVAQQQQPEQQQQLPPTPALPNTTTTKKFVMSMKYDPLRFRPREEPAATAAEELTVASKIQAGIRELARRVVAACLPDLPHCMTLLAVLKDNDSLTNAASIWDEIETKLLFGDIKTFVHFVQEVRLVFASSSTSSSSSSAAASNNKQQKKATTKTSNNNNSNIVLLAETENTFERELHTAILPRLAPAVRAALEYREITDAELFGLRQEDREKVQEMAVSVDGEGVRLFWRRASYAARRRIRALLVELREQKQHNPQQQSNQQYAQPDAAAPASANKPQPKQKPSAKRAGLRRNNSSNNADAVVVKAIPVIPPPSKEPVKLGWQMPKINDLRRPFGDAKPGNATNNSSNKQQQPQQNQQTRHQQQGQPQQRNQQQQQVRQQQPVVAAQVDPLGLRPDLLFGPSLFGDDNDSHHVQGNNKPRHDNPQHHLLQQQQQHQRQHQHDPLRMPVNPHTLGNMFEFEEHVDDDNNNIIDQGFQEDEQQMHHQQQDQQQLGGVGAVDDDASMYAPVDDDDNDDDVGGAAADDFFGA